MIVIGYQGIGKSTLVKECNSYIDFESSNFKINGERPEGWEQIYCEAALDLSRQGHVVFTASHKCIRDYLKYHRGSEVVLIVAPSVDLKDQWLEKLRKRYKETGLLKDSLALLNAENCFDENIKEMQNYASVFPFYEITDMGYKLRYLFDNLLKDEKVLKTFGFKRFQVSNVVYGEEGRKLASADWNARQIERTANALKRYEEELERRKHEIPLGVPCDGKFYVDWRGAVREDEEEASEVNFNAFNSKESAEKHAEMLLAWRKALVANSKGEPIDIKVLLPLLKKGWVAMDKDGTWRWYDKKPYIFQFSWKYISLSRLDVFNIKPAENWENSLMECGL